MSPFTSKTIIATLIVTNIITAGFFILGKDQTHLTEKILAGGEQQNKPGYPYMDNPQYIEKMSLCSVYSKQGKIVMLGNSITERVEWTELLNRNDIINRGIGSDITEGFLSRLNYIYSVDPKICYIMGGVNDIARNIAQEETVRNIKKIIEDLKQHNIVPVLQSVLFVTDTYPNNQVMNQKIESLNTELVKVAKECKVTFLDINIQLSSGNQLIKEYALKDGIHLTGAGYDKWRTLLLADLKKHRI